MNIYIYIALGDCIVRCY